MKNIPLTNSSLSAIVDDEDYALVSTYVWYGMKVRGYALPKPVSSKSINGRTKLTLMHRLIMSTQKGEIVDHIDGNPLNNCRSNLRLCTQSQNAMNTKAKTLKNKTSKYKGVRLHTLGKWEAQIMVDGKTIYLGYWDTEQKAALAYNHAAKEYHGSFARLNNI